MEIKKIADFIFPKNCLHCSEKSQRDFFCDNCLEHFVFKENICKNNVATFENIGPANTLFKEIKKVRFKKIMKVSASFMSVRYLELHNPVPDKIFFFKKDLWVKVLAKEVGRIFNRKVVYFKKEKIIEERGLCLVITDVLTYDLGENNIFFLSFI